MMMALEEITVIEGRQKTMYLHIDTDKHIKKYFKIVYRKNDVVINGMAIPNIIIQRLSEDRSDFEKWTEEFVSMG
jgi:RNA:NAD 2'-phosphotransferase (TPT1/KptA family)